MNEVTIVKKFIQIVLMLIVVGEIFSLNTFDKIVDFFDNPFEEEMHNLPLSLDTLDELYVLIGHPIKLEEIELENRYDDSITNKRIILEYDKFTIYYDYYTIKKTFYKTLLVIPCSESKFKYGIQKGINPLKIIDIFGEKDREARFDYNYNIIYNADRWGGYELQFSFNNSDELETIFLWYTT